jgi:hypothetical protein
MQTWECIWNDVQINGFYDIWKTGNNIIFPALAGG